jgi:hypothetical protein
VRLWGRVIDPQLSSIIELACRYAVCLVMQLILCCSKKSGKSTKKTGDRSVSGMKVVFFTELLAYLPLARMNPG